MAATAEKEKQMNLAALQQRDPYISSIRDSASQVAVYTFNANLNEWVRRSSGRSCCYKRICYTCRILAGRPLRNPVTAPRSSGHQSRNRPIFFARSRSSLVLKPFTVFAITESLSSIFHLDTTRWEKKYFLISLLHRHLTSFNECPRVVPAVSIWNIC